MALAESELLARRTETGEPERRRFTRDEYYKMAEAGIIGEDERVELIHGDIVTMAPIGPDHNSASLRLQYALWKLIPDGVWVMHERPITLPDGSEPEPDLVVAHGNMRTYDDRHPVPSEILVVIETSKSSLSYDRVSKQRLYADAKIPEYWIVNMVGKTVELYTEPTPTGYDQVHMYRADKLIPLSFAPGKSIAVADII